MRNEKNYNIRSIEGMTNSLTRLRLIMLTLLLLKILNPTLPEFCICYLERLIPKDSVNILSILRSYL